MDPSARDALDWMEKLSSGGRNLLFRGQSRVYPTILPSLLRNNVTEEERNAWWTVLRWFGVARNGVTGYGIKSPHDVLALVQHYLLLSPVIDLTGTPIIALYFAMANASSDDPRVVYAVEREELAKHDLIVTDHDFLILPPGEGGLEHRWLKQDGFTVGARDWTNLDAAGKLDFVALSMVKQFTFRASPGELALIEALGDLEAVKDDPLAASVRTAFEDVANHLGYLDELLPRLRNTRTIDCHQLRIDKIEQLLCHARERNFPNFELEEIGRLLKQAVNRGWDTSWQAGLDKWTRLVNESTPALPDLTPSDVGGDVPRASEVEGLVSALKVEI
jgi:hypothetical protein